MIKRKVMFIVALCMCVCSAQGCAFFQKVFARKPVYVVPSSYGSSHRFLAYQAEAGVFKAEMRVKAEVLWKAALAFFRSADILESNPDALTLTVRYRDSICAFTVRSRDDLYCDVEMKITDYNGVTSYNLWGRSLLKKLYNKATSLSFATVRKFSSDDGK